MNFLKWVLILALMLVFVVPAILSHLNTGGPVVRLATLALLVTALALFVPQFRGAVLKAAVSLLVLGLAVLYVYTSVMTMRDARYTWAQTAKAMAVNAWSRGWANVGDIAKGLIPGLGPGTVTEIGAGAVKANAEYQKCLVSATSQLGPQVQLKASTCAKMAGRDLELCLENILSAYGEDQGALSLWQSCREKTQVTGEVAKSIKPIANLFCIGERFLPEFLKKGLCVPGGPSKPPSAQVSATESYDLDCLARIFNNNPGRVPDRNCQRYQTDPQRWQQCVIDSITVGLPVSGSQQVQFCRIAP